MAQSPYFDGGFGLASVIMFNTGLILLLVSRFLTLADNKITKVENLKILTKLQFLDLSDNLVEDFDGGLYKLFNYSV